jgi:hypothetical protein
MLPNPMSHTALSFAENQLASPGQHLYRRRSVLLSSVLPSTSAPTSDDTTPIAVTAMASPSVEIKKLEYKEAIKYLHYENGQIALPRAVDVEFYGPRGQTLCVFNNGQLLLTHETTLKTLVLQLQSLLNSVTGEQDSLLHSLDQLLVCEIFFRVGGNPRSASLPAIKGVPCPARGKTGMFSRFKLHWIVLATSREADWLANRFYSWPQIGRHILGAR